MFIIELFSGNYIEFEFQVVNLLNDCIYSKNQFAAEINDLMNPEALSASVLVVIILERCVKRVM